MARLRSETASLGRAGEGIRVMRMLWPHEPPAKGVTVIVTPWHLPDPERQRGTMVVPLSVARAQGIRVMGIPWTEARHSQRPCEVGPSLSPTSGSAGLPTRCDGFVTRIPGLGLTADKADIRHRGVLRHE